MIDGERRGPFELDSLAVAGVRPDTYVWCKGMADWEKAGDVPEVCRMFRNRIHDLMHPGSASPMVARSDEPVQENPGRFSPYAELPTIEEIDRNRNLDTPPAPLTGWAVLAVIFFFPLGIPALIYSRKCANLWKQAQEHSEDSTELKREAHDTWSTARMWTGIAFFTGIIFWATIIFR